MRRNWPMKYFDNIHMYMDPGEIPVQRKEVFVYYLFVMFISSFMIEHWEKRKRSDAAVWQIALNDRQCIINVTQRYMYYKNVRLQND